MPTLGRCYAAHHRNRTSFSHRCYSYTDEELWERDAVECIRQRFDMVDDYSTPVPVAESRLHSVCKVRKSILNNAMSVIMQMITAPDIDAKQKDGSLHMVGTQSEQLFTSYVFPEFTSPYGHLRARAFWLLHYLSDIKLKSPHTLPEIMRLISDILLKDAKLPVKVLSSSFYKIRPPSTWNHKSSKSQWNC